MTKNVCAKLDNVNQGSGLHGEKCGPFTGHSFAFTCPSGCASVHVLEPHTMGNLEVNYHTMVIGGPRAGDSDVAIYRGDTWICQAAIHAGLFSNAQGGCGVLTRKGKQQDFIASRRNGISRLNFNSSFPLSFSLTSTDNPYSDPQWRLLTISALASTVVSISTSSSASFFTITFIILYFQTALASDAPFKPDFSSLFSLAIERFLPSAFIVLVLYRWCVRRTSYNLKAYFERTILWLGGCWFGALNKYIFDKIPISRPTLTTYNNNRVRYPPLSFFYHF